MGTMDRPGSNGDSTLAGSSFSDQTPSRWLEEQKRARPAESGPEFPDIAFPHSASSADATSRAADMIFGGSDVISDASDVISDAAMAALIASDPYADEPAPVTSTAECTRQSAIPDDGDTWPSDEDIARLVASMPDDGWPGLPAARPACAGGGSAAAASLAVPSTSPEAAPSLQPSTEDESQFVFPFPMADAPWADPKQSDPAMSLLPGPMDLGRVRVIRASVPDLPEAPRPNNPRNLAWSPVGVADALANLDPHCLGENDLLDYIHAAARLAAFAHAMEDAALAVFSTRRPPLASEMSATPAQAQEDASYRSKYAAAEIMALHCVGNGTAHLMLDNAATLADNLPGTTALYRAGLLDSLRIKAILAGVENVPACVQTFIEPMFLPGASRSNPRALTRKIRKLALKHNPEALEVRHQRARTDRRVWFTPLPDGMAQISAVLDAVPAKSLFDSLESWARRAQRDGAKAGGEPSTGITPTGRPSRSFNNYLADTFLDLIRQAFMHPASYCVECGIIHRSEPGKGAVASGSDVDVEVVPESWFKRRIPARISVVVPALTLLRASEEPGYLEGYGPIPPEHARELAGGSYWWERLLTDPTTRARLSVGRQRYHPPADISAEVRRRDPVCTGIGCDHPAATCEIDHTVPFWLNRHGPDGTILPKGETSVENLRPRDLFCHQVKDVPDTGWTVEPNGPGQTKTTTPTGRIYLQNQTGEPCPF